MTASAARRPVAVTEIEALTLGGAYFYTVFNFAVGADEVAEHLNIDVKEATRLLRKLARVGLVAGERLNGHSGPLTWQSMYDYQNEDGTEDAAREDFGNAFTLKDGGSAAPAPTHSGGTGPRYTESQLKAGHAARVSGAGWKAVAEAAGVRSPSYFSRVLRATFPQMEHQREYNSLSQAEKQALGS